LWKAGRYKLAAPVSKTGPASPGRERYSRLPPLNHQTKGAHHDQHSSIHTAVAAEQVAATRLAADTNVNKKDRQVLPTLPKQERPRIPWQDDNSPRDIECCGACNPVGTTSASSHTSNWDDVEVVPTSIEKSRQ